MLAEGRSTAMLVRAVARVLADASALSGEGATAVRASFEAWDGEGEIDASVVTRSLLDWPREVETIRRHVARGTRAIDELEAVDPVRDAWVNAFADLALATAPQLEATMMIASAIERAARVLSGQAIGETGWEHARAQLMARVREALGA